MSLTDFTEVVFTGPGTDVENPTSLQFGPDGKLYVAQEDGLIRVFTVQKQGENYVSTGFQDIDLVRNIPNHDDDGALNPSIDTRLVTGILVRGTAQAPEILVTSSDPRIRPLDPLGQDLNLDTNSGILSKITQTQSGSWSNAEKLDLVRGLPRSEGNHAPNGLAIDPVTGELLIALAGNANAGAPALGFSYLPETALSGAIVSLDLAAVEAMPVQDPGGANPYVWDLPTLMDTPTPFGGMDARNAAFAPAGSALSMHMPGFRNPYDIAVTQDGLVYSSDNGANRDFGAGPVNAAGEVIVDANGDGIPDNGPATNRPNELPSDDSKHPDHLHLVTPGAYGGQPAPFRASGADAGFWTDDGTLITTDIAYNAGVAVENPIEGILQKPGQDGALYIYPESVRSVNGLVEYTSSAVPALQGDILAVSYTGELIAMDRSADGLAIDDAEYLTIGDRPLDIVAPGDGHAFAGSLWVASYGGDGIRVFNPEGTPPGGGRFTFQLVDAETDQVLDADLSDGLSGVDADDIDGDLAVAAIPVVPGSISGSVALSLSGPGGTVTRTESVAPYAIFGDSNGNYFGNPLPQGVYTFSATNDGQTESVTFTLEPDGPVGEDSVFIFRLIDADTDQVIDDDLSDGLQNVSADDIDGNLAVAAVLRFSPVHEDVVVTLDGPSGTFTRTDPTPPFTVFPESGGDYEGQPLAQGVYDVTASGAGVTETISFSLAPTIVDPPSGDPVRVEAEDFTIAAGFARQTNPHASGGTFLQSGSSGEQVATYSFDMAAGTYAVTIGHFDENDGQSDMALEVNGVTVGSWTWDDDAGGAFADPSSFAVQSFSGIALNPGDVVTLRGTADGSEPLRTDYVEFTAEGGASDTAGPGVQSVSAPSIPVSGYGTTNTVIEVTFTDATAVDASTIDTADITVTGPGGPLSVSGASVSPAGDGSPRTASYTVQAPGGTWDASDSGSYTVALADAQVFDILGNASAAQGLGSFTVASDSLPPPFRVEAESLTLQQGFFVQTNPHPSGGAFIQAGGTGQQRASLTFSAAAGQYDIHIGHFDENDGQSTLSLLVNGQVVDSFVFDQDAGGAFADPSSFDEHTIRAVDLAPGDTVMLQGTPDGAEPLRVDYLDFEAVGGAPASSAAEQLHLAWTEDPASSLTVVWRLDPGTADKEVQYRETGASAWMTETASLRPSGTKGGELYEATLTGLDPDQAYEYRTRLDDGGWSRIYDARTAPEAGQGAFDLVFFADTGLIGREDGLSTGTAQVIQEIAALDPDLLLGGGDYISYITDRRFGDLDSHIDAWFDQWQEPLSGAPMMTTYGNHEIFLVEGFEPWRARFPQVEDGSLEDGRFHSFDVADAHLTMILLTRENDTLTQAQLDWVRDDILAAQADGAEWVIPVMHAPPYSDGVSHRSAFDARDQLAPLFEGLEIDVVLTTHDQNYERTYPLRDGSSVESASTNVPTSLDLGPYDPAEDGVVWVKVSPSGKLSDQNDDFSNFRSDPPPDWSAARDNTLHHYARLEIDPAGELSVEVFGVDGAGSPPVLVDSFEFIDIV